MKRIDKNSTTLEACVAATKWGWVAVSPAEACALILELWSQHGERWAKVALALNKLKLIRGSYRDKGSPEWKTHSAREHYDNYKDATMPILRNRYPQIKTSPQSKLPLTESGSTATNVVAGLTKAFAATDNSAPKQVASGKRKKRKMLKKEMPETEVPEEKTPMLRVQYPGTDCVLELATLSKVQLGHMQAHNTGHIEFTLTITTKILDPTGLQLINTYIQEAGECNTIPVAFQPPPLKSSTPWDPDSEFDECEFDV